MKKSYFFVPPSDILSPDDGSRVGDVISFLRSTTFSFPPDSVDLERPALETESSKLLVYRTYQDLSSVDFSSIRYLYLIYPRRLLQSRNRTWLFEDPFIVKNITPSVGSYRVEFAPFVRPVHFSDLLAVKALFDQLGVGVGNGASIGNSGNGDVCNDDVNTHSFHLLDRLSISTCFSLLSDEQQHPSFLSELCLSQIRHSQSNQLPVRKLTPECVGTLLDRSFFQLLGIIPPESVFQKYPIVDSDGNELPSSPLQQQQQQQQTPLDDVLGLACERLFISGGADTHRFAYTVASNEVDSSPIPREDVRRLRTEETNDIRLLCQRINSITDIVKQIMNGNGDDDSSLIGEEDEEEEEDIIPTLESILNKRSSSLRNSLLGATSCVSGVAAQLESYDTNDGDGDFRRHRHKLNLGENLYQSICNIIRLPLACILLEELLSCFKKKNPDDSYYSVRKSKPKMIQKDNLSAHFDSEPNFFAGFVTLIEESFDEFPALLCEEKEGTSVGIQYSDAKTLFLNAFAIVRRLCWCRPSDFAKNFRLPLFLFNGLQCRIFLYRLNVGADMLVRGVPHPTLFLDGILSQLVRSSTSDDDGVTTSGSDCEATFFHLKDHLAQVSAALLVTLYDSLKCLCEYPPSRNRRLPLTLVSELTRSFASPRAGDQDFDDDGEDEGEGEDDDDDDDGFDSGQRQQGQHQQSGTSSQLTNLSTMASSSSSEQSVKLASFLLLVSPLVEELDLAEIELMTSFFVHPLVPLEQLRPSSGSLFLCPPSKSVCAALCFKVIGALCRCMSQTDDRRIGFAAAPDDDDCFGDPFVQTASRIRFESESEFSLFLCESGHFLRDVPSEIVYTLVEQWSDLYCPYEDSFSNRRFALRRVFLNCLSTSVRLQDRVRFVSSQFEGSRRSSNWGWRWE